MVFKFFVFFISLSFGISQSSIAADKSLFRPMQRSWDILMNSSIFHDADVGNKFGFELTVSQQEILFNDASYTLGEHRISSFRMRSLRTSINLPIYLQIGVNLTLPTYTVYNFDTSLNGYFVKFQFNQWLFEWFPKMAIQFDRNSVTLGDFFESSSSSMNFHLSAKLSKFNLYAGYIYSSNKSTFKLDSGELSDTRVEVYPRVGLNFNFLLFSLYGETTFVDGFKHFSAGLSLRF